MAAPTVRPQLRSAGQLSGRLLRPAARRAQSIEHRQQTPRRGNTELACATAVRAVPRGSNDVYFVRAPCRAFAADSISSIVRTVAGLSGS